ncbi:MAG TPA: phage tail protein [Candidatus Binatia bacterium]|nr:phage tail protein [Candidatus Binatia bacterium]
MRPPPGYHFASRPQWAACLVVGADFAGEGDAASVAPFATFEPPSERPSFPGEAYAPAWTYAGEVLWRDGAGELHRWSEGDPKPRVTAAPRAIASASRIVASRDSLWVVGDGKSLECFDLETLSRRFRVELGDPVIDIAGDGRGGVRALTAHGESVRVVAADGAGTLGASVSLEGVADAKAFTYLRSSGRLVVLSGDGRRIATFAPGSGSADVRALSAAFGPCFVGSLIASDTRGRVFIAGADRMDRPKEHVVVLDGFAVKLDDVPLGEPATGIAASRDRLLVTDARGLRLLRAADSVPDSAGDVSTLVVTPMLVAPEATNGRRWLRIEASGTLPPGASLEIAYAATSDPDVRDDLRRLAADRSIPEPRRAQLLRSKDDLWSTPIALHGRELLENEDETTVAVPLHDVHETYLWVAVSLTGGAGAKLPALTRLSVLYPGSTLMENLPAIYQRDEAQPGSFIRTLVGVLETTTQGLDRRIGQMGRYIHPDRASEDWLDSLARWLGLPWDDALDERQKRCIVKNASRIARGRGTRAGLEALLECLVGGKPQRFRVVDGTVDHGLARIGGEACDGAALPAILAGLPATATQLDVQATLGAMRLPCANDAQDDATSRFLGSIRVDVAASARELRQWQPWLERLVTEMIPAGTRARVRWTTADALRGNRLDDSTSLAADHRLELDTDPLTGIARLPHVGSGLPASSDREGPILE